MTKSTIARFAGISATAAMLVGFASPAAAVTVAELQAQIAALMSQLQALQGGTTSSAITSDLTVGSTGSQVVALQNTLVAQGYLSMPAGVAPGYFGSLTKSAVMKWQAAVGLPSTGFVGALSRAKLSGTTTTSGTTTVVPTNITTPGAEGTLTVTAGTISNSTAYSGDKMVPVLAFKARAAGSDLAIQRVKIDLGTISNIYNKVYSKIYLTNEAGQVIASSDLNSSTVVKDSDDRYYITLTGFSAVVPKETTQNYTLKVDVRSISTGSSDLVSHTVRLAANGVRAVDGAGIDQYSPSTATAVTKDVTAAATLADSATLTVSANVANPLIQEVVAASGSAKNEADKVALLTFDVRAEKDNVNMTDLVSTITAVGGTGLTASSSYLYAGNGVSGSPIGSASLSGSTATFSDINYMIPKDTTKTFTIAVDVRSANSTQTTLSASVANTQITAENSNGDSLSASSISGSATSNTALVRNVGAVFTLVGTPTISRTVAAISTNSTSTATVTFNINVTAKGGPVLLGTLASTSPAFTNGTGAVAPTFAIFQNGSSFGTTVYASSTDFSAPSGYTVTNNTFTLTEGQSVNIPVTFWFQAKTTAGADISAASYAVGIARTNWVSNNGLSSSTFMSGKTEWRTSAVSLP